MKWITIFLFFNVFWILEYVLFMFPTRLMKLGIGLWILLPQLHGEFFVYNLVSDQLDKFELKVRVARNNLVHKFMYWQIKTARKMLGIFKPYVETKNLQKIKLLVDEMDKEIIKDLTLRKKMIETGNRKMQIGNEVIRRDSSVLGVLDVKFKGGSATDMDSRRNILNASGRVKSTRPTTAQEGDSISRSRMTYDRNNFNSTQPINTKVNNFMKSSTKTVTSTGKKSTTKTVSSRNLDQSSSKNDSDYEEGVDSHRSYKSSQTATGKSTKKSTSMIGEANVDALTRNNVNLMSRSTRLVSKASQ
mmetsp:Transcript_9319/g.6688  ORF Transcript_9319/g.6688 Transcript_9319/m.6688 type:complete len:303 (+) Transcript_9319:165-1073(+)